MGYEEYEPKGVVEECIEKLVLVRERLNAGEMKEARKGEVERVVGALGEYVERVLVVSCILEFLVWGWRGGWIDGKKGGEDDGG